MHRDRFQYFAVCMGSRFSTNTENIAVQADIKHDWRENSLFLAWRINVDKNLHVHVYPATVRVYIDALFGKEPH